MNLQQEIFEEYRKGVSSINELAYIVGADIDRIKIIDEDNNLAVFSNNRGEQTYVYYKDVPTQFECTVKGVIPIT